MTTNPHPPAPGYADIELTPHNMMVAAISGVSRRIKDVFGGVREKTWMQRSGDGRALGWQRDVDGACGELAVAKYLNRFWDGALGNTKAADVGTRLQVRTTHYAKGCLILYDKDVPAHLFVLVLCNRIPTYRLAGWAYGGDVQLPIYWNAEAPNPAFFYPQSKLLPMESLRDHLL